MELVTFATRVCKLLEVQTMIGRHSLNPDFHTSDSVVVTNAAGGLNPEYNVGDIMILNDVRQSLLHETSHADSLFPASKPGWSRGLPSSSW